MNTRHRARCRRRVAGARWGARRAATHARARVADFHAQGDESSHRTVDIASRVHTPRSRCRAMSRPPGETPARRRPAGSPCGDAERRADVDPHLRPMPRPAGDARHARPKTQPRSHRSSFPRFFPARARRQVTRASLPHRTFSKKRVEGDEETRIRRSIGVDVARAAMQRAPRAHRRRSS